MEEETASPSPSATPVPAPTPTPGPAAGFALAYDPQGSWDPYGGNGGANGTLFPLVYEGLYALDSAFAYAPVLAEGATVSEDGLIWTVTLREGVAFSDGTPLTAQLAGQAINRARGKESPYAARLSGVVRVGWSGERELHFTLSAPNCDLPALLDVPIALVAEDGVYGTGPYTVGEEALERREDWWQGKALPRERFELAAVTGADALIAGFDSGRVSLAAADLTGPDALGYAGGCRSWDYPTSSMVYVGYRADGGFCADPGLRQALSMALDRETVVSGILGGHAREAAYPAPPGSGRYNAQAAEALAFDLEGAGERLDELGYRLKEETGLRYKGRNPVSLTLLVNSDNSFKVRIAHRLAEDLGSLGLTVTVKAVGWEEYRKTLEEGQFDLYLGECRLTGDLDPSPFFTWGSGLWYGGFWDETVTAALADARATGRWGEFDRLWLESAPFGVICFKTGTVLTAWGRCEGLDPTQGNVFYGLENWTVK